ncbi:MAG TPA: ATPase, T2SS/T4P/T4SS family, partial [Elusimicrobiota bacterium]|nr:ATPase, T2SS/T4P/T4SS family [Elusimicrobiota bacterium]
MPEIEKLVAAFEDPGVVELMINDDGGVFVERAGAKLVRVDAKPAPQDILAFVRGVVGAPEEFGPRRPYADLTATDGSRVHVISPPLVKGLTVTVRKRPASRPTLRQLVDGGTLTDKSAGFLDFCVRQKMNVMVVGGTSSGKTTLLAALAAVADPEERVLVLEDTPELTLPETHKHVLYMRTRLRDAAGSPDVTLRDLVLNTLRMRPDRVIVGETRGPEAADMLQAMNVGTDGFLTTLHANSAREAISRLETLVLQAGIDMPLKAIRQNIVSALDFVVFLARLADGSRRVVQIAEVTGLEVETVSMADLFVLELRRGDGGLNGRLRAAGTMPRFYDRLRRQGFEPPLHFF